MRNKRPGKPRGRIGPVSLPGGFTPVGLPETKEEIEEFMLAAARRAAARERCNLFGIVGEPARTIEADLDFTITTKLGQQYIELTEFAPLEIVGGRYDGAPVSYHQGAMADLAIRCLLDKASKYAPAVRDKINLLMYITDWRFRVSQGVLSLLAFWALRREHGLASIVYYVPADAHDGELVIIHPDRPERFASFDSLAVRNRLILRPDLSKAALGRDESSFDAPLSWPPWRGA